MPTNKHVVAGMRPRKIVHPHSAFVCISSFEILLLITPFIHFYHRLSMFICLSPFIPFYPPLSPFYICSYLFNSFYPCSSLYSVRTHLSFQVMSVVHSFFPLELAQKWNFSGDGRLLCEIIIVPHGLPKHLVKARAIHWNCMKLHVKKVTAPWCKLTVKHCRHM